MTEREPVNNESDSTRTLRRISARRIFSSSLDHISRSTENAYFKNPWMGRGITTFGALNTALFVAEGRTPDYIAAGAAITGAGALMIAGRRITQGKF